MHGACGRRAPRRRGLSSRVAAGKVNKNYWLADYRGFVEFFVTQAFTEPHSIKQREEGVGWGLETTAETLLLTIPAINAPTEAEVMKPSA